jgi:hypothetical protein
VLASRRFLAGPPQGIKDLRLFYYHFRLVSGQFPALLADKRHGPFRHISEAVGHTGQVGQQGPHLAFGFLQLLSHKIPLFFQVHVVKGDPQIAGDFLEERNLPF